MKAKIVDGKVRIEKDAPDVKQVIAFIKEGLGKGTQLLSTIDAISGSAKKAGYPNWVEELNDIKRLSNSVLTQMRKEASWLND